jgi:hypothetical protein
MSDGVHLLIPFAACSADGCHRSLQPLALPNLERLLARLAPAQAAEGDDRMLSMPHERVLARECGLDGPDGLLPWAAWQVRQRPGSGHAEGAWAWITPCHWRVARDHVAMAHPHEMQLDAQESQALLAAMKPYFEQDGITLDYDAPNRWLARGDIFARLPTASMDRVVGRILDPWIPRSEEAKGLRRLQQEMQMLLYTHPANDERTRRGLLPVNSFWISGTGELPSDHATAPPPGLKITQDLRDPALLQDWPAWADAWQRLDAGECARLLQAVERGEAVALSLCGERSARTWRNRPAGLWQRLSGALSRPKAAPLLIAL